MKRCGSTVTMVMSVLLGVMLVEAAAFAGVTPPWGVDPNGMIRLDPNEMSRLPMGWDDPLALEKYQQEGAEVTPWSQEAALPSPDNAALLYYQAFLLRPQPDDAIYLGIKNVLIGGEPDSQTRAYLGDCRRMIHTVEIASLVPQCAWGIRHLDPAGFSPSSLAPEIDQIAGVLDLDARTLGFDGHYGAAFARCLTIRRLARHTGDDTMLMLLVSRTIDYEALRATQHVLGLMPPDANTLRWLRGQLTAVPSTPESLEKALQSDMELLIASLRKNPDLLQWTRQQLAEGAFDESARQKALSLTDEEVLAHVREIHSQFLDGVFRILDSNLSYERKYAELDTWTREYRARYAADPAGWMLRTGLPDTYSLFVRNRAGYNALKIAVEIYLEYADTGQLPEILPDHSLNDPFSGQDFEYEITQAGFTLRCRAEDLYENRIWQYEFKVRE